MIQIGVGPPVNHKFDGLPFQRLVFRCFVPFIVLLKKLKEIYESKHHVDSDNKARG